MKRIFYRVRIAFLTLPSQNNWLYALGLLLLFAVVYLPIGLGSGFLTIAPQLSWPTILGVALGSLLMPGLNEELMFRALLIPHPSETVSRQKRWIWIALSLILFILYHLHPFTPVFFKTPVFILGAGLVGVVCTLSYLRSGSIWCAIVLHWLIVVIWLLIFGGLRKFQG
jgi:predicted Abi (CAAX) family protease